jgi:recombinational DNA repair protein RecR
MAIFNSYVKLPEGIKKSNTILFLLVKSKQQNIQNIVNIAQESSKIHPRAKTCKNLQTRKTPYRKVVKKNIPTLYKSH